MAQQFSHHTTGIKYHLIWLSVFFIIVGSVQCCNFGEYGDDGDYDDNDEKRSVPRDFIVDLERNIKAINGNDMDIIKMLISQNKSQLATISKCYNDCYKRDLIQDLKNKFTGKLEQIVVALVTPEMEYTVKLIHDAMIGIESDSHALIDILCTQNYRKLKEITAEYQKLYRARLIADLDKYNTGLFRKLLVALLKWRRNENTDSYKDLAKTDALALDNDIFDTDRTLMKSILVTGSFERIRQAVYRYHNEYKQYYESKIAQKYGGDIRRALITIVRWSKGKNSFYAEKLHDSLNFVESDDDSLVRIIVSNVDNMEPIKKQYEKRYNMSLERAIRKNRNGPFASALIALINREKQVDKSRDEKLEYSSLELELGTPCRGC